MIAFKAIVLREDGRWYFVWDPTGVPFYRATLFGELIETIIPGVSGPDIWDDIADGDTWDDDGSIYDSWKDSILIVYPFPLNGFDIYPPDLEVAEGSELTLSEINPPFLVMQWYRVLGTNFYRIEHFNGVDWDMVETMQEDGHWVYTYHSPILPDDTLQRFQIIAVDQLEQDSDPLEFQLFVIRVPYLDQSTIKIGYNNPNLVISVP